MHMMWQEVMGHTVFLTSEEDSCQYRNDWFLKQLVRIVLFYIQNNMYNFIKSSTPLYNNNVPHSLIYM